MSNRVSQTILLCEDALQERLTKAYMKLCGLRTEPPYVKALVASRLQEGGNIGWVLNEFPKQLHASRRRHKKAKTLLILVIDADAFTVEQRRRQLSDRVANAAYEPLRPDDPSVLLIPRRHIET
jgi:hypothetical protein